MCQKLNAAKSRFFNNDLFGGSYRRNWKCDYHCSKAEIKSMLRDATKETEDMKIVEQFDISVIDTESLKGFRNHINISPNGTHIATNPKKAYNPLNMAVVIFAIYILFIHICFTSPIYPP